VTLLVIDNQRFAYFFLLASKSSNAVQVPGRSRVEFLDRTTNHHRRTA
jgi:hypothetical protein